jgi:hypothetical protein
MDHFTTAEIDIFSSQIKRCMRGAPHPISDIEWQSTGWAEMRESVLGKYNHLSRTVLLNEKYRNAPEFLVSTLCHELHHKLQHESMGAMYWIAANWFTRDRVLERSARELERYIDKQMGMDGIRDGD